MCFTGRKPSRGVVSFMRLTSSDYGDGLGADLVVLLRNSTAYFYGAAPPVFELCHWSDEG